MVRTLLRLVACLSFLLAGCASRDERIRELVREELAAAAAPPAAVTDARTIGPYSPAMRVGKFLFVSGQIALEQESGLLENESIESETRQVLENLSSILRQAGFDSTDVVATTVYLREIADYPRMNLIYGGYFQEGRYPARSTVQVAALPRDARVEISAIAYKSHQ
jgi:2-iminobutanoate/2-iminopropanoate deaminase